MKQEVIHCRNEAITIFFRFNNCFKDKSIKANLLSENDTSFIDSVSSLVGPKMCNVRFAHKV